MSYITFTRDEIILSLDALYFSGEKHLTENTEVMKNLSLLMNRLPIHPMGSRDKYFRTPKGIARQINSFKKSKLSGVHDPDVGKGFFVVDNEFENHLEDIHIIAKAIQQNVTLFESIGFGNNAESPEFPEGALLGHLHRVIETRDSAKLEPGSRCEICMIDTAEIYPNCPNIMEMHLAVPITALDGNKRYGADDFITVCPNCHAALHRRRPWLTKKNCGELLC